MDTTQNMEEMILEKIETPNWSTARGVLKIASGEVSPDEIREIEDVMKSMAKEGKVDLWRLILHADNSEMLAASKPGFDLGEELKQRKAWADAVRYSSDE